MRGRDLRDVRHDAASRNGPAGPGPATDLAMILASSASTCAWTCSGRPSHRAGESSWPANKASCRAGAILRTRIGSPLPSFAAIRNEVNLLPFPGLHRQEHPNRPQPRSQPAARPPRPVPPPGPGGRHQAPTRTPDHGARADPKDRSRAAPQPAPAPHRLTHPTRGGPPPARPPLPPDARGLAPARRSPAPPPRRRGGSQLTQPPDISHRQDRHPRRGYRRPAKIGVIHRNPGGLACRAGARFPVCGSRGRGGRRGRPGRGAEPTERGGQSGRSRWCGGAARKRPWIPGRSRPPIARAGQLP